jgi:hypothetical protein
MRRFTLVAALLLTGLTLGVPRPGAATVGMQDRAKDLGYPADDCSYCHSFSRDHMTQHAREAGLRSTNCIQCHGASLPLDGVDLYSARGRFLLEVKKQRKARKVEMAWLADYVEEKKADPKK